MYCLYLVAKKPATVKSYCCFLINLVPAGFRSSRSVRRSFSGLRKRSNTFLRSIDRLFDAALFAACRAGGREYPVWSRPAAAPRRAHRSKSLPAMSSFWRFFSRMMTMSVAVQAPSAIRSSSIGPGRCWRCGSESITSAWPEGLMATNLLFADPLDFCGLHGLLLANSIAGVKGVQVPPIAGLTLAPLREVRDRSNLTFSR